MDVDETKKRKIEEETEVPLNLDEFFKTYVESQNTMAKLLFTLSQKVITLEKVFNKDLLKP